MVRLQLALALSWLAISPAVAFAQATATHWSARWALPIYLGGALVLGAIGIGLKASGWNRLGALLWILVVTSGGCLAVYAMQGAALGEKWQLPLLLVGLGVFVAAGEWAMRRLKGA